VEYGGDGTAVTAVPETGYHFVDWSDGSTANPRTDTNVMADVDVTANFAINIYDLTIAVIPTAGGTTNPTAGVHSYEHSSVVDVTQTPAAGYEFSHWSGDCAGSGACQVTIDEEKTVTANYILTGGITVFEVAEPMDGTEFTFSGDLGSFNLSGGESEAAGDLLPGDYTITQTVPSGWSLIGASCTGADYDVITNGVTVHLDEGESAGCTFTNHELGTITIEKATDPAGGTGFEFTGDLGDFSLDDGGSYLEIDLDAGTYTVTEEVKTGWILEEVDCTGGDFIGVQGGVRIELEPGDDVTCSFGNQQLGSITIEKATDPAGGVGFAFTGDLGAFSLDDGGSKLEANLITGQYGITETIPTGWVLENVTCTGGDFTETSDGVVVDLDPGEDVTCTFNNQQLGSITIEKVTDPAGGTDFDFTGDLGAFSLDDGGSQSFSNLAIGSYSIDELLPGDWQLAGVSCTGGDYTETSTGVSIELDAGESIICTFDNQAPTVVLGLDNYLPFMFNGSAATPLAPETEGLGERIRRIIEAFLQGS
jgi:hypothetical protein